MRILGIDPGSRITGYGVIETSVGTVRHIDSGCIKTVSGSLPERLDEIYHRVSDIINRHNPDVAVVEQIFVSVNPGSALKLGHARGAAICACMASKIKLYEYTPREIKKTITGYGGADKEQVQYMVSMLLMIDKQLGQDEADALAAALAHYHYIPFESERKSIRRATASGH
ncbi:MAG: crossover junction endodeoxyribonuclease RuvC [Acidiferrobacterales bacterium]|nr:crossover junction endodeoxyribonuclease RuvC [Acidiferrobacterales bacterium]